MIEFTRVWEVNGKMVVASTIEKAIETYKESFGSIEPDDIRPSLPSIAQKQVMTMM